MKKNDYIDFHRVTTLSVAGPLPFQVDVYGDAPHLTEALAHACDRTGLAVNGLVRTVEGATYRHVPYRKRARPRHEAAVPPPLLPEAPVDVPRLAARDVRPPPPRTGFLSLAEERRAAADRAFRSED